MAARLKRVAFSLSVVMVDWHTLTPTLGVDPLPRSGEGLGEGGKGVVMGASWQAGTWEG